MQSSAGRHSSPCRWRSTTKLAATCSLFTEPVCGLSLAQLRSVLSSLSLSGCSELLVARYSESSVKSGNNQAMKPGDWICSSCGDLQFARNEACRKSEAKCGLGLRASLSHFSVRPQVWRCKAKRSRTFPKPCSSLLEVEHSDGYKSRRAETR